ncbi:Hypothetical Protein FCC1311_078862 [Hondaea fermentalgiana]|uniref:Glycosyltransferase 2-like domain-containing protein n=1 Tax=Hondaea fermentalgiana TaxID=2315210 RepID=A0A2R5GTE7_9STRA|nr:Hypothetical Protein FCC1311_078862 [Hondaea fermentalgiana]|eukprot:GBG31661.1 Hypothetical Protein FCC1311_078862 [Hondaea fermentalgiana]
MKLATKVLYLALPLGLVLSCLWYIGGRWLFTWNKGPNQDLAFPSDFSLRTFKAEPTAAVTASDRGAHAAGRPCADEVESWKAWLLKGDRKVVGIEGFDRCQATTVGLPPHRLHPRYCNPSDLPSRAEAVVVLDVILQPDIPHPEVTIVSPSHQDGPTLEQTMPSLCAHTQGEWEVVFVLDGSWDHSYEVYKRTILSEECKRNGLVRGRVVLQPTSIWETAADNLAMSMSSPSGFYVEVQADTLFLSDGWLERMLQPMRIYDVLFAVSGRCGHELTVGRALPSFSTLYGHCKGMDTPAEPEFLAQWDHKINVMQSVNRGPYAVRAKAMQDLGFYDELNFFLERDEHDLHRRATFLKWNFAVRVIDMYHLKNVKMSDDALIPSSFRELDKRYMDEHAARAQSSPKCPIGLYEMPVPLVSRFGEVWPL